MSQALYCNGEPRVSSVGRSSGYDVTCTGCDWHQESDHNWHALSLHRTHRQTVIEVTNQPTQAWRENILKALHDCRVAS